MLVVFVVVLCAYFLLINLFIGVMDGKGYTRISHWQIWFIGIVLSPFAVGLFAASLPDRRKTNGVCTDNDD